MDTITKKYIFEQKLKGEPVEIPRSNTPWYEENVSILVECGILEEGEGQKGRYWVRYPILFHGSNYAAVEDKWHELKPGQRLANTGDEWDLR